MIVHITARGCWEAAREQEVYRCASLEAEGFIHCSKPSQVLTPANALFFGKRSKQPTALECSLKLHSIMTCSQP